MKVSRFEHVITRTPCRALVDGISSSTLGRPIYERALQQHHAYVRALQTCDVAVTILPPAEEFPDSVFVEDPALCTPHCAVVTRPGADRRRGEADRLAPVLNRFSPRCRAEQASALIDGFILDASLCFQRVVALGLGLYHRCA